MCDGKFYVGTWLGYNTQWLNLGGAVSVFCRCSEHLKSVDLIKEIILDVGGPHPIRWKALGAKTEVSFFFS